MSMGFTDGMTDHCQAISSEDAGANSDADGRHAALVLSILDFAQTVLAECELTSFDADGFTVNWTTNNASAYIIHYLAIGGADLSNVDANFFVANTSTGEQSITGVGFQPDALIFISTSSNADPPATAALGHICVGYATSSAERGVVVGKSRNGFSVADTERYQQTDECIAIVKFDGGARAEADFVSMDADGFTINRGVADVAWRIGFLALKGGQYFVGSETQKTSTGAKATTGVGFEPTGLLIAGFNAVANASVATHNRISLGAASAAGIEGCTWIGDTDAAADMSTDMSTIATKVLMHIDTDGPSAVDAEADLDSFDADGFTLGWTTADAVARQFIFLAMGDAAADGAATRRYSLTVTGVG
jgi:hypothetical protein